MILIDGVKYSCLECIRGHRSSLCQHYKRPLLLVKRKGRPSVLFPDGNKNYRIAVFAQEIAEQSVDSEDEKCTRPVVILKASDKYVFDFKTGQIVGPYNEDKARAFDPESFVNVSFCCVGSLSQKGCRCNQKKVSKQRILQSYLKKNQGKVDMEKLMKCQANGTIKTDDTNDKDSGCCSIKVKKEALELGSNISPQTVKTTPSKANCCSETSSCCSGKTKGSSNVNGSIPEPIASFNNPSDSSIAPNLSNDAPNPLQYSTTRNYSNPYMATKHEPDFARLTNTQGMSFDLAPNQFQIQSQLPGFQTNSIPNTSASNIFQQPNQYQGSLLQARPQTHMYMPTNPRECEVSETFTKPDSEVSDSNIFYFNSANLATNPSSSLNVNNSDMSAFGKLEGRHHFDYAAAMQLQQEGTLSQQFPTPSNRDLLVYSKNQVFKVVNVPSCSVPGTCLCSDDCACENCETHNTKNTHSNQYSSLNQPLGSHGEQISELESPQRVVVPEARSQDLDYMGFLKLIISEGQEDNWTEDSRSDSLPGEHQDQELCSCAEGACFCSNCERHGIIDGVRLDDFFGAVEKDHSIDT